MHEAFSAMVISSEVGRLDLAATVALVGGLPAIIYEMVMKLECLG